MGRSSHLSGGVATRTILIRALLTIASLLVALQLIPSPIHPLVRPTSARPAHLQITGPAEVGAIFDRSCRDCHSNQTQVPWYGHVAPMSWMLAKHVNEGREKLNFSDWASRRHTANEMEDLCDAVSNGSMPLPSYTLIHRDARLSKSDVDAVCSWADTQGRSSTQASNTAATLKTNKGKETN